MGFDYTKRQLSKIEEDRIAKSINSIKDKISAQIASGKTINPEFFTETNNSRKPSIEICEGVLQKCKLEYEELKIQFISNIFAMAPFISEFSSSI